MSSLDLSLDHHQMQLIFDVESHKINLQDTIHFTLNGPLKPDFELSFYLGNRMEVISVENIPVKKTTHSERVNRYTIPLTMEKSWHGRPPTTTSTPLCFITSKSTCSTSVTAYADLGKAPGDSLLGLMVWWWKFRE